ncbi:phospholipase D-like domain-containing protein [Ureaplasma parvum]|uniref:Cardiolipin synthase n=3 Tax=Ureaplasma parvum TaxID=134821 RepID=Q9PPQ1_UREPA|nr:phosphatidylserine/phosphatidylglycerophosphate/cardiolipin synthase family protein [Ureaplasma parvum]pir/G82872/ cardiolipin synthase UU588 [imported] - Ureaplasma urealyticum [Ureaplasma urealyticum]AAF31002.1 cardiolipin synthase [Ureaplasma parvum serovar 3 str. ATCC 700970]ACA32909.1 cardiolipin synthase [Ureaplasma parvum serovar 3 str. ATCC 27815]ASD24651.1 cardiolipin synthase [Ureaplasma parvum]ASD25077.1 cardiolipin synthase [Ureaplasma parvum]ASD29327.1 cardiolipin synthase [Ur
MKKRILAKFIITFICVLLIINICLISIYFHHRPTVIVTDILISFYILNTSIGLYILSSRHRQDRSKKSWLFIFLFLPIVSIIFFWIFGSRPFKDKKINDIITNRRALFKFEDYEFYHSFQNMIINNNGLNLIRKIGQYNYQLFRTPIYCDNQITIIKETNEMYEQTIKLIRKAKKTIYLQYYIIENGRWLQSLVKELIKKSNDGIKIYILYDPIGSLNKFPKKYRQQLINNGIEIACFKARADYKFRSTINFRSHRKYLIIDGEVAISGGSNIGDSYLNIDPKVGHWVDLNYILTGGIVHTILLEFIHDWYYYTPFSKKNNFNVVVDSMHPQPYLCQGKDDLINNSIKNKTITTLLHTGPDQSTSSLNEILVMAIANAKKSITIFTPYLFPTEDILIGLKAAANTGIKVKIILPGRVDSWSFIISMNRLSYESLIKSGVQIYEYSGFLHTKAILIDDDISLLGSYNLDNRALVINYESLLTIYSIQVNHDINEIFNQYLRNSQLINLEDLDNKFTFNELVQTVFINIFQLLL